MKSDQSIRKVINKRTNDCIQASSRNQVKCSHGPSESPEHREMKCFIGLWAWEHSVQFCTEAVFHGTGRADFVLLDLGTCIEVLHSEKLSKFDNKDYPIQTIPVQTSLDKKFVTSMLDDLLATHGDGATYYIEKLSKK